MREEYRGCFSTRLLRKIFGPESIENGQVKEDKIVEALMGEKYEQRFGKKYEEMRPLGRPKQRREDDIK